MNALSRAQTFYSNFQDLSSPARMVRQSFWCSVMRFECLLLIYIDVLQLFSILISILSNGDFHPHSSYT